jgi:hypothetical protein
MIGPAEAKVDIHATYRPAFLIPWHVDDKFSMEAQKADDGTWVWKHLPSD